MFDINFYIQARAIQKKINAGEKFSKEELFKKFEQFRSKVPVVYNIETTNACNMRCEMCPRTTMMTRPVNTLKKETFERIIDQLKPFSANEWNTWEKFCASEYGISRTDMSENHFFLYIIPKVIQLHGYGDPLLDKHMADYVRLLHEKGFFSYFSCNPANIDMGATRKMFENNLDYIKYSLESVSDETHKKIRGTASDFSSSYKKILELLALKQDSGYKTTIIITMLNLNRADQMEDFKRLQEAFAGKDVYIYLKSEDQQWYRKDYHGTASIHWSEICKHPWMSMTIKSNGEAAMCMEDFNNEIILGDATQDSLSDIWNGEKYRRFRQDHFNLTSGLKCKDQCDMHLIGEYCK
jgi:radical SAM protein with 4Fe4S-binding SPASM domain